MNYGIKILYTLVIILFVISGKAQKLEMLHEAGKVSLRGLSIYKNTIWVSGSAGNVGRSADGGNSWQWISVKGFENTEFRDIEAIDEQTAIIMGIGSPAHILKTTDGGKTWKLVYNNTHPTMFLDAMSFTKNGEGVVVGDPVNGRFFTASTQNGNFWQLTNQWNLPVPNQGEAFFAASGSNLVLKKKKYYIVSGGTVSRLFTNKKASLLPLQQGRETTGANSVVVWGKQIAVAGGDFARPNKNDSVFAISKNSGKTWKLPLLPPGGYRSSVCFVNKNTLVTCGINGIDVSVDAGKTWNNISKIGFNTCIYSKTNKVVYFVGNNSGVGKIKF